ncbi:MAG: ABC transporter permease subunit [Planctomycetes bacterium]|nr:ABC transporter permease subunit [Planctomycetota bacterium]
MKLLIYNALKRINNTIFYFLPALLPMLPMIYIIWIAVLPAEGNFGQPYKILLGPSPIIEINNFERHFGYLLNTLLLGTMTVIWASILSIPSVMCISRLPDKLSKFFRAILVVPLLLPPFVLCRAFMDLLMPDSTFSSIYQVFSGVQFDYNNVFVASFVLAIWLFPVLIMFLIEGLRRLDFRHVEAMKLFSGRVFTAKHATIPLMLPSFISGAIIVFILAINNFGVPALLNISTLPTTIYATFDTYFDWRRFAVPAAHGTLMFIVLIPAIILLFRAETRMKRHSVSTHSRRRRQSRDFVVFLIAMLIPAFVFFLSAVTPMLMLGKRITSLWTFKKALQNSGEDILRSLFVAASAALISMIIWCLWAIVLSKKRNKLNLLLISLAILPLAFPRVLVALGIMKIAGSNEFTLVMSYAILFSPFVVRAAYNAVQEIHPSLAENLAVSGLSERSIFLKLYLPLTLKPVISAGLLIMVFSLGEVVLGQIISPPGYLLISTNIYNLIHYSADEYVAALSIILMVVTSGIYFAYLLIFEGEINKL